MGVFCAGFLRDTWARVTDRCFRLFPCLSDPARRSTLCLKVALVTLHLIFPGALLAFDEDFIEITSYTAIYVLLLISTLVQYFITCGTSPGYVLEAQKAVDEIDASSKNGSVVITVDQNQSYLRSSNLTAWTKLVMDMYPPGSSSIRNWTCSYCNVVQPPRAKHCLDCEKCVLQFDHHCVWLGTCVGQRNHCRFWWYILEETALCLWTCILYVVSLKSNISKSWWIDVIMILLLGTLSMCLIFLLLLLLFHSYLILTNQTTYELVRRRRVPYLRGIPQRVYPFSKGVCRNLYVFCCAQNSILQMEPIPSAQELEEKAKPYTCLDVLSCRCC